MSNELPWTERVNMLAVNPDVATRHDVARLASELGMRYLKDLEITGGNMSDEHEHHWSYDPAVYAGRTPQHCTVRRWCYKCGLLQHSHTTGRWYESQVGPTKQFGEYPEGYEIELIKETEHE